jgi:hypothetical protein
MYSSRIQSLSTVWNILLKITTVAEGKECKITVKKLKYLLLVN